MQLCKPTMCFSILFREKRRSPGNHFKQTIVVLSWTFTFHAWPRSLSHFRHYPKTSFTIVADTPENLRLRQQSELQSQVNTHTHTRPQMCVRCRSAAIISDLLWWWWCHVVFVWLVFPFEWCQAASLFSPQLWFALVYFDCDKKKNVCKSQMQCINRQTSITFSSFRLQEAELCTWAFVFISVLCQRGGDMKLRRFHQHQGFILWPFSQFRFSLELFPL